MKIVKVLNSALALTLTLSLAAFGTQSGNVQASSHREAPMIVKDQFADNTDLYAFVSPDKPDTVTLIANFIPLEDPGNGPNFYRFDDDVLYEINVDNVGDAQKHISYQFRFNTTLTNPDTSHYNGGPIESIDSPNLNVKQRYTVTRMENGTPTEVGKNLLTPPVNVGPKSTPNYEALSNAGIYDLSDGSKVFAGQADDSFFIDFSIFDLLTIRKLPGNAGGGVNSLKGFNVHTIAIQVPITKLTANAAKVNAPTDANAVIGVWSTTSRQTTRVLQTGGKAPTGSGDFVQISRLGMPLVNEVVVPTGAKDLFNNSKPADDAQFLAKVTNPEFPTLLNKLYNIQVPPTPRDDLVAIFLTGIKGATMPPNVKPSEQLRLNMGVPPSAQPNSLGVLGGDMAGFPNGRRLADDIVDASIKVMAGAAYPLFHPDFKPDPLAAQLGDGVDANDVPFRNAFPYVALAQCNTVCGEGGTGARNAGYAAMLAPSQPPVVQPPVAAPGMPKTGLLQIDHLGDIYGLMLGLVAIVGGLILTGGYAVRRKSTVDASDR